MLGSIKEFLKERLVHESRPVERGQALRVATAAILLEVSRADFETDESELEVIAVALRQAFDLGEDAVREIIAEAREQDDEKLSLYPFLRIVNDACAPEEKYASSATCGGWPMPTGAWTSTRNTRSGASPICCTSPHPDFIRAKLAVQGEA